MSPELYYNTSAHISQTKGDEVTCNFNGTSIEVVGGLVKDHGNYTVRYVRPRLGQGVDKVEKLMISIDGGPAITLNGSHPSFQAQSTCKSKRHYRADTSLSRYQPQ
jgi:hypothetical protein